MGQIMSNTTTFFSLTCRLGGSLCKPYVCIIFCFVLIFFGFVVVVNVFCLFAILVCMNYNRNICKVTRG